MSAKVINLKERTDRWETIQKRFADASFPLERVDAIKMQNAYEAVFLKHRELLHQAQIRGEKHLLIFEDDSVPRPDYDKRWKQIKAYLDSRDDWECFNGGMLSIRDCVSKIVRIQDEGLTTMMLDVSRGCMAHWIYFKVDPVLEKIKDWEKEGKPEFDSWYAEKLKTVACVPYLAIQDDGFSDAAGETRQWEQRFKHEEITMLYSLREFISA